MSRKQIKRCHNLNHKAEKSNIRTNNNMKYEGRPTRPILYSSEDVERMAIESSRARLMMQLLSEPEESLEKTDSYIIRNNVKPVYMMTSQTAEIPVSRRNFAPYPTLVQGLRWSSSIETYSEDSQTDTSGEDRKFKCKCHRCKMNKCLAQRNLQNNTNGYSFKDNIVQFSDNSTMTQNLRESGCGVRTPLHTENTSEVSICTSDVTVREVIRKQTPQNFPTNPTPILKKSDFESNHNLGQEISHRVTVDLENSVNNHVCSDYENLLKCYAKQQMIAAPSNKINGDSRKVLYNEGISNSIAKDSSLPNFPPRVKRTQMKFNNCNRSYGTHKRLAHQEAIIPYTHQTNSKYHNYCKKPNHFHNGKIQDDSNFVTISTVPIKPDFMPSIKLPKRVLPSEKNIEAFMDKRPTKMSSAFKY